MLSNSSSTGALDPAQMFFSFLGGLVFIQVIEGYFVVDLFLPLFSTAIRVEPNQVDMFQSKQLTFGGGETISPDVDPRVHPGVDQHVGP